MKALIIFAKLALAATVLAGSAYAQTISTPVTDHLTVTALNANPAATANAETIVPIVIAPPSAEAEAVAKLELMADSISPESAREATVEGMTRVIDQIVKDRAPGSTKLLHAGKAIDITTMIDTDRSVAAWHSVNLKASYDTRPIGGILNIRVGLAPVFGGIGAAVRTVNYREFAEAINDFNDDFVAQTISRLTKELAAEYVKDH